MTFHDLVAEFLLEKNVVILNVAAETDEEYGKITIRNKADVEKVILFEEDEVFFIETDGIFSGYASNPKILEDLWKSLETFIKIKV